MRRGWRRMRPVLSGTERRRGTSTGCCFWPWVARGIGHTSGYRGQLRRRCFGVGSWTRWGDHEACRRHSPPARARLRCAVYLLDRPPAYLTQMTGEELAAHIRAREPDLNDAIDLIVPFARREGGEARLSNTARRPPLISDPCRASPPEKAATPPRTARLRASRLLLERIPRLVFSQRVHDPIRNRPEAWARCASPSCGARAKLAGMNPDAVSSPKSAFRRLWRSSVRCRRGDKGSMNWPSPTSRPQSAVPAGGSFPATGSAIRAYAHGANPLGKDQPSMRRPCLSRASRIGGRAPRGARSYPGFYTHSGSARIRGRVHEGVRVSQGAARSEAASRRRAGYRSRPDSGWSVGIWCRPLLGWCGSAGRLAQAEAAVRSGT